MVRIHFARTCAIVFFCNQILQDGVFNINKSSHFKYFRPLQFVSSGFSPCQVMGYLTLTEMVILSFQVLRRITFWRGDTQRKWVIHKWQRWNSGRKKVGNLNQLLAFVITYHPKLREIASIIKNIKAFCIKMKLLNESLLFLQWIHIVMLESWVAI